MKMLEIDQSELVLQIKEEVPDENETNTPECDLNQSAQVKKEPSMNSLTQNQVQQIKEEESYDIEFSEEPEFKYDISGYAKTDSDETTAKESQQTAAENVNEENLETFECDNLQCFKYKQISEDYDQYNTGTVETAKKAFPFRVCKKRYSTKFNLKEHEWVHTGQNPHSCNACGKKFNRKRLLNEHIKCVHSGEKPYPCDECGKRFAAKRILKQHEWVHTGQKMHSCDECGKRFSTKGSLRRHEWVHTGQKLNEADLEPFNCEHCLQNFTFDGITQHLNEDCKKNKRNNR